MATLQPAQILAAIAEVRTREQALALRDAIRAKCDPAHVPDLLETWFLVCAQQRLVTADDLT